ncbi:unnamed protein product [Lactuca virosa]|uniref:Protein argonaute N-terminal domain-containing protein n=1 Tax=Lactuca virosa TaxID=75947 RepID=A0AAU9MPK3_9ASTR|nr:unnamed protein product [Lactuca virosa]
MLLAYDGMKTAFAAKPLPFESKEFVVKLTESNEREQEFKVNIKFVSRKDLHHLRHFLSGRQHDNPQEIIQDLDVVLREAASINVRQIVGRSLFSTEFGKGMLGGGIVYCKRFFIRVQLKTSTVVQIYLLLQTSESCDNHLKVVGDPMETLQDMFDCLRLEFPEIRVVVLQADNVFKEFVLRELSAVAGAITNACIMVAKLVGFVIGPSGISWLKSVFLQTEGLPTLFGLLVTFYVGTKVHVHSSWGSGRKLLNVWVVLTFVAIWHDLEWYLILAARDEFKRRRRNKAATIVQKANLTLQCLWRSKVARKELRMLKLAARDSGALREAKDKLEK